MKRLLVAVDGSDHAQNAVRHAVAIHRKCGGAEVHLLTAEPAPQAWQTHGMEPAAIEAHLRLLAREASAPARALLDGEGVPHTSHVHLGDPAPGIVEAAERLGCDAIVMGTRGRGAVAGLFLGSVAMKVVALAKVPVTLVK